MQMRSFLKKLVVRKLIQVQSLSIETNSSKINSTLRAKARAFPGFDATTMQEKDEIVEA